MVATLIKKFLNKETINYLIFGIITTLINIISYKLCTKININYIASTVIAWSLSVAFAYITNKLYVFESKSFEKSLVIKEATSFVLSRVFSGTCDLLFMIVSVELFSMNDFIAKIFTNVFVVVINYVISKMFIFKNKKLER